MTKKTPLNEVRIDYVNFRNILPAYNLKEIEKYLKDYDKKYKVKLESFPVSSCSQSAGKCHALDGTNEDNKSFHLDHIQCILTYIVEEKGKYIFEGEGKGWLGELLTVGNLIIKGDADVDCGLWMSGGSILVERNAGDGAGSYMAGGKIICLGKIGNIEDTMQGGLIYADEFGKVPENVKKFTSDLPHAFLNEYSWLPKEFKKMFNEKIKKEPEKYFPYANNNEKRKLLSSLSGVDERTIEFEYEKGLMW